jgi:hypothetical protein
VVVLRNDGGYQPRASTLSRRLAPSPFTRSGWDEIGPSFVVIVVVGILCLVTRRHLGGAPGIRSSGASGSVPATALTPTGGPRARHHRSRRW